MARANNRRWEPIISLAKSLRRRRNADKRVLRGLLYCISLLAFIGVPASTAVVSSGVLPDESAWLAQFDAIPESCSEPVDQLWAAKVDAIKWVAYSSPSRDPAGGYYRPSPEAITEDLRTLKKAGFTGLITYASSSIMGKQFITIAQSLGYQGIIMGIWSPAGQDELDNAVSAATNPIVLGYSIGNEGLGAARSRYSVLELCAAIASLRARTGKPVSTSEDIEMYYRWPQLLSVGDWLFPIAHPYWHFTKYAADAIQWEQDQYAALQARTSHYILFKEVGLPTAGAAGLSEANQDAYYRGLAKTEVRFAYFEGFDQPSKSSAAVEPHWGIFNSDLTPKLLAWNMMGYRVFTGGPGSSAAVADCPPKDATACNLRPAGTLVFAGYERGQRLGAILSFNTAGLPDDATITAVKLKVKSAGTLGADPFGAGRSLVVDICLPRSGAAGTHPGVVAAAAAQCVTNAGTFDGSPNSGWYTVDLLPASLSSVNVRGATQFRLRVIGPVPAAARSYIRFFSPEAAEPDCPILLVKYRLP